MSRALWRSTTRCRARRSKRNRGIVVKMTGDGMYAAFDDPLDAA